MRAWKDLVGSGLVRAGEPLHRYTTYKLGGPARYLMEAATLSHLERLAAALSEEPLAVLVVGRGSNLVVADEGFPGVALRLVGSFATMELGEATVAGGAAAMPQLARAAVRAGRLGLEFMVGIPGSVGGGIRQNAGCFGVEMVDVLSWAEVFDLDAGTHRRRSPGDLALSYRSSNIGPTQVVTFAGLYTEAGASQSGETRIREITRWRKEHQPGGSLNAGSVFKNPPGDAAGRIIDALGLKGLRVGGATVSEKHANFFVAGPGATAADVYQLVMAVQNRVERATGIRLEPEIQFAGEFEVKTDA